MIYAFIMNAWGRVLSLPPKVRMGLLIALACVALLTVHKCAVREAVEADRAAQAAKVLEQARGADEASRGVVDGVKTEVERKNEESRKAADGSDDPLRAGLERLR